MAQLTIRNRDTGITVAAQEFTPETRLSLYETYMPGEHIVCGTARYHVHTVAWDRTTQEFIVGVSFEETMPVPEDIYC